MPGTDATIDIARDAAAHAAWADAYAGFHEVDLDSLRGSDLEAFADAAWWGSKLTESLELRQRAYSAYVSEGEELAAAACAARVSVEHFLRNEPAIGMGFLKRTERHMEGRSDCVELGYLAMLHASIAGFSGDAAATIDLAAQAIEIGQRFGDPNLVGMSIHIEGLALINRGRIDDGVALLDEAMALVIAGELDPFFTGIVYCAVISACLELNDLGRAAEWSDASRPWYESLPPDSPFPGMCRVNRAEVASLRGAWEEAEVEARGAVAQLLEVDPSFAAQAFFQLGEILRRSGDLAGAEQAFLRALEMGVDPQPGLALLRFSQGKTDTALTALRLTLTAEHQPARRARLLAALAEVAVAADAIDDARAAIEDLGEITGDDVPVFAAMVAGATGRVQLAEGEISHALTSLRRAVTIWQHLRLPYETARMRVVFGRALRAAGDEDGARVAFRSARSAFEKLGAGPDAAEAETLAAGPTRLPAGLTAREAEVLRLVAAGKTNRDIAVELVISEHTVARHLQNMFAKLGVSTRAAATAFAYSHGLA
jgi:DNA-binding CsgD family transcriptional regulator/predicted negative regulator of RcsB-dependent stress response